MRKPATPSQPAPASASAPVTAWPRFPAWLIAALLALVTIALYWPATGHDFVNFDDNLYVLDNPHVTSGLTWESLKWAFFKPDVSFGYWHPLTLLSHMLDCQLFGLNPWGHHLTSVLLHALNTVLVFLLLRRLTGATWRSLWVAALFAWHPLHVESVAWVAERKDVLSACFGLLALVFYARYAQVQSQPPESRNTFHVSRFTFHVSLFYLLSLSLFALGLLSKPMLVTLPFVLLLLDYWPLRRLQIENQNSTIKNLLPLLREKLPFFALAAASSVLTFVLSKHGGALTAGEEIPLGARAGNALISYCRYLGKLFWPTHLAFFYPHPGLWPLAMVLLAGALLLGLSGLFWAQRRRSPFLLMGWLWFVGMLVPAIGLIQVGEFAMADRYTYLPSLGVLILAVWGAYELARPWRPALLALSVAASAAIILCLVLTRQQLGYWQDSETLFRHALDVTEDNWLAYNSLGVTLSAKDQTDDAIRQFQDALRLKPDYADAHNNLGIALLKQGQTDDAIRQYQETIRLRPNDAGACNNLGVALARKGQTAEAIPQFQEAIRLNPDYADAHYNLGVALYTIGQLDDAIRQFQQAVRLRPGNADAHNNLGYALDQQGQTDAAIRQLHEALRLKPDYAEAHNNLGAALVKKGQTDDAIRQFQEALRLKPDDAEARTNLARALGTNTAPPGR
jgi:tetratricopeptide (TPR) repeat protein